MKNSLARAARCALLTALLSVLFCVTASAANPFTDVRRSDEYYTAVMWALDSGVTSGTSATTFSPGSTCNRGQVVTFLWRAAGQPEPASLTNPFTDVTSDSFCYKAALWAVQQGITNGTSATTFSPQNPCTYAHVLTFLWRSAGSPAAAGTSWLAQEYAGLWYTDALAWADINEYLDSSDINPGGPCPRADIVSYLYGWAAPGSVLSLFPELTVDEEEISEWDIGGTYRGRDVVFTLEAQWDGESPSGPEMLSLIQDASTAQVIGGLHRISGNFYQSTNDDGDLFAASFFRRNGIIYLDYYRNGVHQGAIPRDSEYVSTLSEYMGHYEAEEGFYPTLLIEPAGGGKCRILIQYKWCMWEANGTYDVGTGSILYTDGVYSERDRGEDWHVVETGYAGALYFDSEGVLRWYDHNADEEAANNCAFIPSSWDDD